MDNKTEASRNLRNTLYLKNNIDCSSAGLGRIDMSDAQGSIQKYVYNDVIGGVDKRPESILKTKEKYENSIIDNQYANNMLLFVYLLSYFQYD